MMPFRVPWRTGLGGRRAVGAAVPWYLSEGIAVANCIAAYQPKGAASLAASYINLANPGTYDAATGTEPAWDATNGWKFASASSQYLTTGIVPGANWTLVMQFSNKSSAVAADFGLLQGGTTKRLICYGNFLSGQVIVQYGDNQLNSAGQNKTSGNIAFYRRVADSKPVVYYNGSELGVGTAANWATVTIGMFIGARNNSDTADEFSNIYIQAWAAYNANLTDAQILALSTAMAAL